MLWVVFALGSVFLWAAANIADKVLRTRYVRSSIALAASFGLFGAVFLSVLVMLVGVPSLPPLQFFAAAVSGLLVTAIVLLYISALSLEEASRVIPLFHLSAVFTLIFAVMFLGEVLTPMRYAAFTFILAGGMLISARRMGTMLHFSPAVLLILLASVLDAAAITGMKFVYGSVPFWDGFVVLYAGVVVGELLLFLLPSARSTLAASFRSSRRNLAVLFAISTMAGFGGHLLFNAAVLYGPVTLVSVFVSFQSLFVLLMATFLSLHFPLFLREDVGAKTLGVKLAALALMALGLFLAWW